MSSSFDQDKINPDEWVSQAEAAQIRGVSRQAIHELVKKGRFRTYEIAGKILVWKEDVVMYEAKLGGRPPATGAAGQPKE